MGMNVTWVTECENDCGRMTTGEETYCSEACRDEAYADAEQYRRWLREGNETGWPLGEQQPDGSYRAS